MLQSRQDEQHPEPWQSRALGEDRSRVAEEAPSGEGSLGSACLWAGEGDERGEPPPATRTRCYAACWTW